MNKQILAVAIATVFTSSTMAASEFEGTSVYVGFGSVHSSSRDNTYTISTSNGVFSGVSASGSSSALGANYTFALPDWLLGVGADYDLSSTSAAPGGTSGGGDLKFSNRYSVYVMPGFEIDKNKMAYAKIGYSSEQTKAELPAGSFGSTSINASSTTSGYVFGLGYKQLFDKNFYYYLEADYSKYSGTTINFNPVISGNKVAGAFKVNPSAMQYMIGAGYKF